MDKIENTPAAAPKDAAAPAEKSKKNRRKNLLNLTYPGLNNYE